MGLGSVGADLAAVFAAAGCTGTVCVRALADGREVTLRPDEPVVPASVMKVQVALEAEILFAEGNLDPREPVTLAADRRTPGPVGVSLFEDDAVVSARDLVTLMLTISDNHATDALLSLIGVEAVNRACARLGLAGTLLVSDLATMLDGVGHDLGFDDWATLGTWSRTASLADNARLDERLPGCRALDPTRGTRTSARDMVVLLEAIWGDRDLPATACARVRAAMARQLTRHRIASAFRPPVQVAAKSGSLLGVVRNEVGVVAFPDGAHYAVAVFTRSRSGADDPAISRAIGEVSARAVAALRVLPLSR
jgi:beta-lactamase class A